MKTLIILLLTVLSLGVNAQQNTDTKDHPIQDMNTKGHKGGKALLMFSGASFIAGSLLSYKTANASEPNASDYTNMNFYNQDIATYQSSQKANKKTTAILYGIGGLTLAIGAAITF